MISDDYFYNLSKDLLKRTEELTLTLLRRVRDTAKRIIRDPRANINLSQEERAILQLWKDYNQDARAWVDDAMPKAYKKGLVNLEGEQMVAGRFSSQPLFGEIFAGEISDRAKELLKDNAEHWNMYGVFERAAYSDFNDTRLPIVRSATDKLRELAIEASDSAYRNADTLTRRDLTQELMTRFADEGITGVRYSDGRTMNIQSYSEMIARSQTGNASRQAHLNRMQEYGKDLVVISTHFPCSNLCIDQQGNVYSISGRSNVYPPLRQAISNGLYHANSYIKDMETYTKNGWKKFSELDGSETILSLNPETHIPEWSGISELHSHESEKMIELKSNSFDLCVTPDHDLYIGTPRRNKGEGRTMKYKFEEANKAVDRSFFAQLRCVNWEGETQDMPISGINEADFARLLAWFISDGYVDGNSIRIAKSKEMHVAEMKPTLENIGFYHDGTKFTIYNKEWAEYFKQFGKSYEKFLPKWILENRPDIITFFLDAHVLGDGHKRINEYKDHEFEDVTYFTSSTRLAEQLGECIIKAGYYPSFSIQEAKGIAVEHRNGTYEGNHDIWRISRNTIKESYYLNSPSNKHKGISAEEIDYNDTAYCVTLEKNHIMWVRRNGKTTWSGNCKHSQSGYTHGQSKPETRDIDKRRNREMYEAQKRQRAIERKIRHYKKRKATAVDPQAEQKAQDYISKWQKKQRQHIDDNPFLRRRYSRESV